MQFKTAAKYYSSAEQLAAAYLSYYFENQEIHYPINPFRMLKDEGVLFSLMNFKKLEGVYIPKSTEDDIPMVGINVNRPITRQRYTAAHELCHHFRDSDKQISCPIKRDKNETEIFAEKFAAALLMPMADLQHQVDIRKNYRGYVEFDDVLEIAEYFGVSFESCLFRIAYQIHAIAGNTESDELKRQARKYRAETKRKARHMSHAELYAELIDCYEDNLAFEPNLHARLAFQNNYIYSDSRMEGLDVTEEQASEIVADLRLKSQNSEYCQEGNEAYMSVAGHYEMYQEIFTLPVKSSLSVFDSFLLNRKLFSHYPAPEYGGQTRQNNTLVLGAKFETVDYHNIIPELTKVDTEIREYFAKRRSLTVSEYIKQVARSHHRLTVIHPFGDGNGRTLRAFMNVQMVRAGITPFYIKVEDKDEYLEALARADTVGRYDDLYEVIFKLISKSSVELNKQDN